MSIATPYIGVSGFMSRAEVHAALDAFCCGRQLMVGVLASAKTLEGQRNKYWRRYPRINAVQNIFVDSPRCLNLVHYSTDYNRVGLARELAAAVDAGGPFCHGIQLNIPWPDLSELIVLRGRRRDLRTVLQLGHHALEQCTLTGIKHRLDLYVQTNTITDVLFDMSGGRGEPLDVAKTIAAVLMLRSAYPGLGIGVAGGLCAEAIPEVAWIIAEGFSVDAEGRLRDNADGGGDLDLQRVRAYLEAAGEAAKSGGDHART